MVGVKWGGMVSGASQCRMLGSLNNCRLPMIEKTTATTIAGRSAGSLIERAIRTGPAPPPAPPAPHHAREKEKKKDLIARTKHPREAVGRRRKASTQLPESGS